MIVATTEGAKVFLSDGTALILKAYASPDGKRLRIVLPDLVTYAQVRHCIDGPVKYLEFCRVPPKGAAVIK